MSLRNKLVGIYYRVATSSIKVRNLLTLVGVTLLLAFVALFIIASIWLDKSLKFPKFPSVSWSVIISMPILAIGLFLIVWPVIITALLGRNTLNTREECLCLFHA